MVMPSLAPRFRGSAAMVADQRRQRKNDMETRHRPQPGLPLREPLSPGQSLAFGTVTIATGVASDARCATIIASLDLAPEERHPARCGGDALDPPK